MHSNRHPQEFYRENIIFGNDLKNYNQFRCDCVDEIFFGEFLVPPKWNRVS